LTLGRVERVEELVEILGIDAHSGVAYRQPDMVRVFQGGDDQEVARAIIDCPHRISGVEYQI